METIQVSNIDELNGAVKKYPGRTIELTVGACIDGNEIKRRNRNNIAKTDWSTWRPIRKPLARAIATTITTEKDAMWNDFLNKGISHMSAVLADQKAKREIAQEDAALIDQLKAVYNDPKTSEEDKDQAKVHIEGLGGEV